jgi:hypothetical protein
MKDWKTTTAGILTLVIALAGAGLQYLHGQPVNLPVLGAALTAAAGLWKAADSK